MLAQIQAVWTFRASNQPLLRKAVAMALSDN